MLGITGVVYTILRSRSAGRARVVWAIFRRGRPRGHERDRRACVRVGRLPAW